MTGRVEYANFEDVRLRLGRFDDGLTINNTIAGATHVSAGKGSDSVKIEKFTGALDVNTGDGGDTITIFDGIGDAASKGASLAVDGGNDGDTYDFTVARNLAGISFVNLKDSGTSGLDVLTYNGSSGNDLIQLDTVANNHWSEYGRPGDGLLISYFDDVAKTFLPVDASSTNALTGIHSTLLSPSARFQVVNYTSIDRVTVFAGPGDDKIISDDTAQSIDVYGNDGDDQVYVGSILATAQVSVDGQVIEVVTDYTDKTTYPMNFYGGEGNDYFEVNHNQADIALYGDNGDDTFFVKALLTLTEDEQIEELATKQTTVSGTFNPGAPPDPQTVDTQEVDRDSLYYVENANIKIDGGAGFDSVAIVGTALSDTFFIYTEIVDGEKVQRIYGAGIKLTELLNVERIQLITGAGDDRVYLLGVDLGPVADMVINTGAGSDTVIVGTDANTPGLTFNLNYPTYRRQDYFGFIGAAEGEPVSVGPGINIRPINQDVASFIPFETLVPAHTETFTVPQSSGIGGATAWTLADILNPVLLTDPEGLTDSVIFNNLRGPTNLIYDDRLMKRTVIKTAMGRAAYPAPGTDNNPLTDLVSQLRSLPVQSSKIRTTVDDYLKNQVEFTNRYYDTSLVDRLVSLPAGSNEAITIPAGISYAAFQDTLDGNQNVVTARAQLDDFLAGTGFMAEYDIKPHPDPSRSDELYTLTTIYNPNTGQELAFKTQNKEILLDGNSIQDVVGVSLITAGPVNLKLKDGYIVEQTAISDGRWNSLHVNGEAANVFFGDIEQAELNLNSQAGTTL